MPLAESENHHASAEKHNYLRGEGEGAFILDSKFTCLARASRVASSTDESFSTSRRSFSLGIASKRRALVDLFTYSKEPAEKMKSRRPSSAQNLHMLSVGRGMRLSMVAGPFCNFAPKIRSFVVIQ